MYNKIFWNHPYLQKKRIIIVCNVGYRDYANELFCNLKCLKIIVNYSGTSPYGHLTSKVTSPLESPFSSPKVYSLVQISPL